MQEHTSHAGRPLAKRAAGAVVWVIVAVLVTLGAVLVACSAPPP